MRYLVVALLAATTLGVGAAAASDLPARTAPRTAPMYSPAPVFSWTGFYIGVNGGYGWNNSTGDSFCTTPGGVVDGVGCTPSVDSTLKPQGGFFGGQAGYNYQSGPFVYGIETDFQWSDIKDSATIGTLCCNPALVPLGTLSTSQKLEWFGTLRGRLGYAAFDRGLLYVTGGLIYGKESISLLQAFPAVSYPASSDSTRTGWTVGGGLEYAFNQNLTGKIEGLYYDMGSETIAFTSPITGFTESANFDYKGVLVRGGLNWKF